MRNKGSGSGRSHSQGKQSDMAERAQVNTGRVKVIAWGCCALFAFVAAVYVGFQLRAPTRSTASVSEAEQIRYFRRVRQLVESGRYSQALQMLEAVQDTSPLAAEARFRQGQIYHGLHQWSLAEKLWKEALRLDPRLPEVGWHLIEMYFIEERLKEAAALALQQFRVEPEPHDRVLWLLEIVRQEHERIAPGEAIRMLEPVRLHDPENLYVLRLIGRNYITLGRISEGIDRLNEALRLDPDNLDTWFFLVWALYEQGEFDRVGKLWSALPESAWDDARFLRYHGMWLEAQGRQQEALADYEKGIQLAPFDRKLRYQLAQLLRRLGRDREADVHAEQAVAIDQARERLGQLYQETRAINDDPSPDVCRQFAQCWEAMGRLDQAQAWREEASYRERRNMGRPLLRPTRNQAQNDSAPAQANDHEGRAEHSPR